MFGLRVCLKENERVKHQIHTLDITQAYVWHGAFKQATWLIDMFDMCGLRGVWQKMRVQVLLTHA